MAEQVTAWKDKFGNLHTSARAAKDYEASSALKELLLKMPCAEGVTHDVFVRSISYIRTNAQAFSKAIALLLEAQAPEDAAADRKPS